MHLQLVVRTLTSFGRSCCCCAALPEVSMLLALARLGAGLAERELTLAGAVARESRIEASEP